MAVDERVAIGGFQVEPLITVIRELTGGEDCDELLIEMDGLVLVLTASPTKKQARIEPGGDVEFVEAFL